MSRCIVNKKLTVYSFWEERDNEKWLSKLEDKWNQTKTKTKKVKFDRFRLKISWDKSEKKEIHGERSFKFFLFMSWEILFHINMKILSLSTKLRFIFFVNGENSKKHKKWVSSNVHKLHEMWFVTCSILQHNSEKKTNILSSYQITINKNNELIFIFCLFPTIHFSSLVWCFSVIQIPHLTSAYGKRKKKISQCSFQ